MLKVGDICYLHEMYTAGSPMQEGVVTEIRRKWLTVTFKGRRYDFDKDTLAPRQEMYGAKFYTAASFAVWGARGKMANSLKELSLATAACTDAAVLEAAAKSIDALCLLMKGNK